MNAILIENAEEKCEQQGHLCLLRSMVSLVPNRKPLQWDDVQRTCSAFSLRPFMSRQGLGIQCAFTNSVQFFMFSVEV